jgi:hypothetical protein
MAYRTCIAVLQDGIWVPVVTVNWEGVGKRRVWHPAYGEFIHVGFFRHMWEPEFRDSDDELMAICRMGQLNQTFDPNTKLTSEFMLAKLVEVDVWKLIWGLVDAIKEKDNSIKIDCSYRGRDNYGYHDDDDFDGRVDGILFEGDCRDETVALVKLLMTRYHGVTGSDINIMKRRYSHGLLIEVETYGFGYNNLCGAIGITVDMDSEVCDYKLKMDPDWDIVYDGSLQRKFCFNKGHQLIQLYAGKEYA